jgi:hypothetical protein
MRGSLEAALVAAWSRILMRDEIRQPGLNGR